MTKHLILAGLAIALLIVVMLFSAGDRSPDNGTKRTQRSKNVTSKAKPVAIVEPVFVDLGVVSPGDVITHCTTIRNRSDRVLRVLAAEPGGRGPRFDLGRFDVAPRSDESLSVTIRSSSVGQFTTAGTIYTDDPNNHTVRIQFSYTITTQKNGV